MEHVLIIGNGIAGITAARHIRKLSDLKITVISSETPYFFSRTALMYVYMGHMTFDNIKPYEDWFWKKNRIDLVFDHAQSIDTREKSVALASGSSIAYDKLIIACGSQSGLLNLQGADLPGVQALYSYQDLQNMEKNTRGITNGIVVGGGLIGVEMAEMLHSRKIKTTMLVRESAYWSNVLPIQEARMISHHISAHGVDLRHDVTVEAILSDERGSVKAVRTTGGEEIDCDFVGIAVGVHPNVGWLANSGIAINRGILVNDFLETNIAGVYAIGDCAEKQYRLHGRKDIEQVWYTARMMGEVIAQTICGDKTRYEPGPWFNSAKFFDIEFQTYGNVPNTLPEELEAFYWEHESKRKAIHVVWNKRNRQLSGINSFGIRLRHAVFDQWLRENRTVDFVMQNLDAANFDPEFTERHEPGIRAQFLTEAVLKSP